MGSLWNRSGTIERLGDDVPAAGAQAFFFVGGTTTPLTVFQDAAESSAHPHPLLANAHGRWPDVFVAYTVGYDVQVKSAGGEQLTYSLQIPNPDPVDLTVTIAPEEKVQTGMIHAELVNTTRAGYVRLNGRTIGNAASTATERANADTSALFTYLWNNLIDAVAPVSGGRGGSAAADFGANKTITLPSCRGTTLTGLDDMGNAAAGAFTGLAFTLGSGIIAGSVIGINKINLAVGQLPSHTHPGGSTSTDGAHSHTGFTGSQNANHTHSTTVDLSGTTGGESVTHTHNIPRTIAQMQPLAGGVFCVTATAGSGAGSTDANTVDHSHTWGSSGAFTSLTESADHQHSISSDGAHSHTFTVGSAGSGDPINNLPLSRLVTWYIKL